MYGLAMRPRSPLSPPDPHDIRSRRSPELVTANCELGYACRRWPSPPSDTEQVNISAQLDSSSCALAATVGGCLGHGLDAICDLRVEIDGHRIKVGVEQAAVDPQRDAGVFVAQHSRHRKSIRAGWQWCKR
jgi:hypothetical protein